MNENEYVKMKIDNSYCFPMFLWIENKSVTIKKTRVMIFVTKTGSNNESSLFKTISSEILKSNY